MTTFNTRSLFSILAYALLVCTAFGSRGELKADGTLRTRGVREGELRVTVMPLNAPAYTLPVGSKRFILELELDNTFVVTFEQAGCITKQLYFDTTVPADMHGGSFTFPFQVTLDARDEKHAFAYAGPVGFVRYHHHVGDFGFETNYTVLVDPSFGERSAEMDRGGSDPIIVVPTAMAARVVTSGYHSPEASMPPERVESSAMGTLAPTVGRVPLMVHRTGGGQKEVVILVVPADEVPELVDPEDVPAPVIVPLVIIRSSPVTVSLPPEVRVLEVKLVAPVDSTTSLPMVVAITKIKPPSIAAGREEELIVEVRRVTTVVRIHLPEGRSTEYRRVAHFNGGTVFFKDGESIPEHAYVAATGD
jgi:hypothetical protein